MQQKINKIVFWITTSLIFLFEGVLPALTFQTNLAQEGIRHLGYPSYFGPLLTFFKVLGALALIIPAIPPRIKEWAYAGFIFDFLAAFISIWAVDGLGLGLLLPVIALIILSISYRSYHRLI